MSVALCLSAGFAASGQAAGQDGVTLFPRPTIDLCLRTDRLIAADIDLDGYDDLVSTCVDGDDNVFEVIFGDPVFSGARRFRRVVSDESSSHTLAVGDVNGDGFPDVLLQYGTFVEAFVHLGDGDGGFAEQTIAVPTSGALSDAALADMDGDGDLDYVLVGSGGAAGITIRLNGGSGVPNGGLIAVPIVPSSGGWLIAFDADSDGDQDLAFVCSASERLVVIRNMGGGSFVESWSADIGNRPSGVAALDADGDGNADLVTGIFRAGYVVLARGRNDGTFEELVPSAFGGGAIGNATRDLNGDGFDDIVAFRDNQTQVVVLYGGEGGFVDSASPRAGDEPAGVAVGDFNGDGLQDVCVRCLESRTGTFLVGREDGTLLSDTWVRMPGSLDRARVMLAADMDNDTIDEIIIGSEDNQIQIVRTLADGGLETPVPSLFTRHAGLAAGDLDGDGSMDIAFASAEFGSDATVGWAFGDGEGGLGPATLRQTGDAPIGIELIDFDDDGDLDIVSSVTAASELALVENLGGGAFGGEQTIPSGPSPTAIAARDMDLDGRPDLVVIAGGAGGGLMIHYALPAGGFSSPSFWPTGIGLGWTVPNALRFADIDGNGFLDVITSGGGVSVLLGDGPGGFLGELRLFPQRQFRGIDLGDFDADGDIDIAAVEYHRDAVTVLLRRDGVLGFEAREFAVTIEPRVVLAADVNRDGVDDLVVAGDDDHVGVLINQLGRPCIADFSPPFGDLDFTDVLAFLGAFAAEDPSADLAEPLGVLDFSDVFEFLVAFGAGCP